MGGSLVSYSQMQIRMPDHHLTRNSFHIPFAPIRFSLPWIKLSLSWAAFLPSLQTSRCCPERMARQRRPPPWERCEEETASYCGDLVSGTRSWRSPPPEKHSTKTSATKPIQPNPAGDGRFCLPPQASARPGRSGSFPWENGGCCWELQRPHQRVPRRGLAASF